MQVKNNLPISAIPERVAYIVEIIQNKSLEILPKKISQKKIADAIDITSGGLNNLIKGRSKTVTAGTLTKMEQVFGVSPAWIQTGEGEIFSQGHKYIKFILKNQPKREYPIEKNGITISRDHFGLLITATMEGWARILTYFYEEKDTYTLDLDLVKKAMEYEKYKRELRVVPFITPVYESKLYYYLFFYLNGSPSKAYIITKDPYSKSLGEDVDDFTIDLHPMCIMNVNWRNIEIDQDLDFRVQLTAEDLKKIDTKYNFLKNDQREESEAKTKLIETYETTIKDKERIIKVYEREFVEGGSPEKKIVEEKEKHIKTLNKLVAEKDKKIEMLEKKIIALEKGEITT